MPNSFIKARASSSLSWMLTPRKTTPRSLYFCQALSSARASARHGTHQEAQKFTSTALPRKSASLTTLPSNSVRVNEGACLATRVVWSYQVGNPRGEDLHG